MANVVIVQVSPKKPGQMELLSDGVTARYTPLWRTLKGAKPGDIAVWYEAGGRAVFTAWGWVAGPSEYVSDGDFPGWQGPVVGIQWLPAEVDAHMVYEEIGVRGWHEGPTPVPRDKAIPFLRLVGILLR